MDAERTGQVALITGGARGFGKAFGTALAERGATVVLVDRDGPAASEAAADIGPRAIPLVGDVTDEPRVEAIMREVGETFGGLDLLINNAGLHSDEYGRPVAELGLAKLRRLFDVNVMGTAACTLAAKPLMASRPGANIINIASAAAYLGGAYGTSKLAVVGMMITFARELAADGVRVNAIAPGLILTETIRAEMGRETLANVKRSQLLPDADGAEEDIVEAMLYLSSRKARFITGETIRVTGGFAAGP
jgi:3-oxoacyl-[acyl-carrier protein] reductase